MNDNMILVPLRQETVARLIANRLNEGESLDGVVTRFAGHQRKSCEPQVAVPTTRAKRYRAMLRGETVAADSLRGILAGVLNRLADTNSEFLFRLSELQGRSRRHVAQKREAIHPGRNDLNYRYTEEFRPGWWMGTNYSTADVRRILKAACQAAGLSFGRDLTIDF